MSKWSNNWPEYLYLKCLYHTRLVVNTNGREFTFEPGETYYVEIEDALKLLAMRSNPVSGCCGGTTSQPQNYFELVDKEN